MTQQEVQQYIDFHRENGGTGKIFQFRYKNYEPGTLTLEGNFTEACLNPNGTVQGGMMTSCLLYTSPSPRDKRQSRMPSSA